MQLNYLVHLSHYLELIYLYIKEMDMRYGELKSLTIKCILCLFRVWLPIYHLNHFIRGTISSIIKTNKSLVWILGC